MNDRRWTVSWRKKGRTDWATYTTQSFDRALAKAHTLSGCGTSHWEVELILEVVLYDPDAEPVYHWQRNATRQMKETR